MFSQCKPSFKDTLPARADEVTPPPTSGKQGLLRAPQAVNSLQAPTTLSLKEGPAVTRTCAWTMRLDVTDSLDRESWNRLAAWAEGAHPCQSYEWGEFLAATNHRVFRVAVIHDGEPAATALVVRLRGTVLGRSALCIPWGPVLRRHSVEVLRALKTALLDAAGKEKPVLVRFGPAETDPGAEHCMTQARLVPARFHLPAAAQYRHAMVLNLRRSEDDLANAVNPKWRYNIRLAQRRGVEVTQSASPDGLEDLAYLAQQSGVPVGAVDPSRLAHLWGYLAQAGDLRLFVAHYEGRPAAAALCLAYGPTCWLIANPISQPHRVHMPNHLLQWRIISWARDHGYHSYHMGVGTEPSADPEDPLYGVARFKAGFGAQCVRYVGCFDAPTAPVLYRLCARVPAVAKRLSGRADFDYATSLTLT